MSENQKQKIGSVRLGNKRAGAKAKPVAGEISIDIDRQNPVLGNPYVLHNHLDDVERAQVIEAYQKLYEADLAVNGPMAFQTQYLADRVNRGHKLILMCWCAGAPLNKPCHGEIIVKRICEIVNI